MPVLEEKNCCPFLGLFFFIPLTIREDRSDTLEGDT